MRDRWKFYESKYPYFMTCTVVGWLPVLTRPSAVQIIFESWKYLQAHRGLTIFGYVVMENHLHWIARMPDPAADAGDFKSFTARKIIDLLHDRRECGVREEIAGKAVQRGSEARNRGGEHRAARAERALDLAEGLQAISRLGEVIERPQEEHGVGARVG